MYTSTLPYLIHIITINSSNTTHIIISRQGRFIRRAGVGEVYTEVPGKNLQGRDLLGPICIYDVYNSKCE